jgi:alpha-L-fucosidase
MLTRHLRLRLITCLGTLAIMPALLSAADGGIRLDPGDDASAVVAKAAAVLPTPRQIAWQRRGFIAFIHFGMNTFSDREWGEGTEDPRLFTPTAFDARQWVAACKAAGMSTAILTAKHHDGFCLWPSAFTGHSVKNSPWKGGKGDVVREFAEACREGGLRMGIYLSPWDRHEPSYGDSPRYNRHFINQLREVLTAYPGIVEVWFDGACGEGPNGKRQEYDWRGYWTTIRELAPEAAISVRGPDVRWCGNEAGRVRASEWSVIPLRGGDDGPWETSDATMRMFGSDAYGEDLGSRQVLMAARNHRARLVWWPAQVNTSIRPGWFYHQGEDGQVKPLDHLLELYFGAVGGNGQFLLNLPPDRRGLIHENDVARLRALGGILTRTFASDLAAGARVVGEVVGGTAVGDAASLLDHDPDTAWTTTDNPQSVALTFTMARSATFNVASLHEHIASGQRVEAFALEIPEGAGWREIARSTVIGNQRLLRFPDVTAAAVRLRFLAWRVRPTLAGFALHLAPALQTPPVIRRDPAGTVTITAPPGSRARYTLDGSQPDAQSAIADAPISLPQGGTVIARSEALTAAGAVDLGVEPLTRVDFGLATGKWRILAVDSEEAKDGAAKNAIDEDPRTMWHTRFRGGSDPAPHHLAIDLGEQVRVAAVTYLPRQDRWEGGIATRVALEVSEDGTVWRRVVAEARFDNVINSRAVQRLTLPEPTTCRAIRLTVLESAAGESHASAAGIGVIVAR